MRFSTNFWTLLVYPLQSVVNNRMLNPEILESNPLRNRANSLALWEDLKFLANDGGALRKRGLFRGIGPYLIASMYNNLQWSKVRGVLKGDPNDEYIKQGKDVPLEYFT